MADISVDETDISKLKVADLKVMLEEKGLPTSGKKAELIDRLRESLGEENLDDEGFRTAMSSIDESAIDDILDESDEEKVEEKTNGTTAAVTEETKPEEPSKKEPVKPAAKTMEKITFDAPAAKTADSSKSAEDKKLERAKRFGLSTANEDTKKQLRAERFGTKSSEASDSAVVASSGVINVDVDKLKKRAERFGTVTSTTLSKADTDEKKKARAERFGLTASSPAATKTGGGTSNAEAEKLKQRAERFGAVVAPALAKTEEQEKLQKRKAKFGVITGPDGDIDAAKKKRAERFGLSA